MGGATIDTTTNIRRDRAYNPAHTLAHGGTPSARWPHLLTAFCGILGVVTLIGSFFINPGPPPGSTIEQARAFALDQRGTILVGGWLQGVGSFLNVLFVLALIQLAGAGQRFLGRVAQLAGGTILAISLLEVTFYLTAVQAAVAGDSTTATVSMALIKAVQHVFLIAPALLLPVGAALLGSRLLPRVFGPTALALGVALQGIGLVGLFDALQPLVDTLLIVQALWMLVAAIVLAIRCWRPAPRRGDAPLSAQASVE